MLSGSRGRRSRPGARARAVGLAASALVAVVTLSGCHWADLDPFADPVGLDASLPEGEQPCPDSDFDCVTLPVPIDHFSPDSDTWDVTLAVHSAPSDSRGVLVIATGGPGSSGIAEADQRLATMSSDFTDHYDVVFFDQRGVGLSQPFSCDDSLYDDSPPPLTTTSGGADRDAFARAARQFATDCFDEAGVDPADAWQYSTRQAAEDLEAFRQWLGVDRMILYGESYGTEFQQTYAAAHPDHVEELILDGVVDQTTDALPFALERVRTQSAVLGTTLTACDADAVCAADAPGKSLAGYDELARALRAAPRYYRYPLATGGTERRELTIDDLQTAAGGSISVRSTRLQLQRAVNAALQGDDVPLARLAAAASGADPDTGDVAFDPGFSEALFFAVECQDYDFVPAGSSGRRELDRWLDAGRAAGVDGYRLGGVFYSDLPCLFWPTGGEHAQRPEPTTKTPYPVLLLTADTDPNTPTADALRLARRMQPGAALVSLQGGPHVIYGRGERCVDDLVSTTIVSGRLPALPVTVCPGPVADPYAPIPPRQAAAYSDPRGTVGVILSAVLDEPTYSNWPGDEPLTLGCEAGGTVRYDLGTKDVVTATLDHCAWTADVPVTGTVEVQDAGTGDATLSVTTLPFAMLTMQADGRLGGSFRGRPVR